VRVSDFGACNARFALEKSMRIVADNASARPLKVLHLGKYFYPDPGGIESVVKDVVRGTVRAGCDVSVLCLGHVGQLSEERYCGAQILRVPLWKTVASQPLGWRYFREFMRRAREFDVVQVHVPNMLAAMAVVTVRVPGKVAVHWHADVVNHGMLGKLLQPLEWLMLRRADAIIATSEAYATTSPQLRRFRHKVRVVPIGITDPRAEEVSVLPDMSTQIPEGTPVILSIGRLVPYKGFEVLIDAARDLPGDCRVVIVGNGELLSELEARIRKRRVADRVILAGRLDDAALQALFQRTAIFCLPSVSRAEAFGVVLLEAMARGLPVVATDIAGSGVPWVNRHGITGLNVPAGDTAALGAALAELLADPQRRTQMGLEARRRFETEFTSELATQRFMSLYGALAGHSVAKSLA
jgi:glycosyltransferase involved in cell wall biosynthesis